MATALRGKNENKYIFDKKHFYSSSSFSFILNLWHFLTKNETKRNLKKSKCIFCSISKTKMSKSFDNSWKFAMAPMSHHKKTKQNKTKKQESKETR